MIGTATVASTGGWETWTTVTGNVTPPTGTQNLFLAFVPVALAPFVFRHRGERTPLWWTGLALFVLFLPNAPYVITDLVHLDGDVRSAANDTAVLTGEKLKLDAAIRARLNDVGPEAYGSSRLALDPSAPSETGPKALVRFHKGLSGEGR